MRLAEFSSMVKAKAWHSKDIPKDVFAFIAICLVGFGAFFLVRIINSEASRKAELQVIQNGTVESGGAGDTTQSREAAGTIQGAYVASKTGTAYYLPWCGAVHRIKEENKVWFKSKEEAEAKGYKPAGNCKGI